jgi:hypothetical protein
VFDYANKVKVVGILLIFALALYEIFVPHKEPLIPVHLFKNKGWVAANLLLGFGASVYYATGLVWPEMVAAVSFESLVSPHVYLQALVLGTKS